MGGWRERLERFSAAVAFAEANDRHTALEIAGMTPSVARVPLEDAFAAVAFAEAGCHETAREIMGASPETRETGDFLAAVGLKGVRVWFGMAQLAESVDFASAVGIKGVRVVYGVAHVSA